MVKACWFCTAFSYTQETPGYSELTPGDAFGMSCMLGHWCFDARETTQEQFGSILQTAENCKDYDSIRK